MVAAVACTCSLPLLSVESPITRQARILREARALGGRFWFADEREEVTTDDGLTYTSYSERESDSPDRRRVIDSVSIWSDEVPESLLEDIAQLEGLRQITVTPPVARTDAFNLIRCMPSQPEIDVSWQLRHAPVVIVETREEFNDAVYDGPAVYFFDHSNSVYAAESREPFLEAAHAWSTNAASPRVQFAYSEFDHLEPKFSGFLVDWMLKRGNGAHIVGLIVWMDGGRILHWEPHLVGKTAEDVVTKTNEVFGGDGVR